MFYIIKDIQETANQEEISDTFLLNLTNNSEKKVVCVSLEKIMKNPGILRTTNSIIRLKQEGDEKYL